MAEDAPRRACTFGARAIAICLPITRNLSKLDAEITMSDLLREELIRYESIASASRGGQPSDERGFKFSHPRS